jgi:acetylornithine deacetylase/succinyl-diaminopimelate desuccinylase-like protein
VRALLIPTLTEPMLRLLGDQAKDLHPLVRNTVAATIINAGESWNVIPSEASVELDARLLPRQEPHDLLAQLKPLLPQGAEVEVVRADPPPSGEADLTLLPLLAAILTDADPEAVPFPMLSPGITDARFYTTLGIQTYGFLPMRLPPHTSFDLIHATNERVPADAIEFGTQALHELFRRYGREHARDVASPPASA